MQKRELIILTPKVVKPEEFEEVKEDRPFVMRAELPLGAEFIQMVSVPTVVDMFGLSSGGGPPGFSFFIDPDIKRMEAYLFFLIGPNIPFEMGAVWQLDCRVLGTVQCLGMLLGAVQVRGVKAHLEEFLSKLKENGSVVFDMARYQTPDIVKARAFPVKK